MKKLGLIAGNGKFPVIFAQEAKVAGYALVAVAHRGETLADIEPFDPVVFVEAMFAD